MADPFSIAASSFAVLGVADVVLRTCLKCHRFLSDIQDAPASVETLTICLLNNTSLVQSLKKHIYGLKSTASPVEIIELQPAIEHFKTAIGALRREMDTLSGRFLKYNRMSKTWANVKHVVGEKEVRKIIERMEHSKSILSVALSLVEGKRSAISQKKIESAIVQSSQQTTTALTTLRDEQKTILSRSTTILFNTEQQARSTRKIQKELRRSRNESTKQNATLQRQVTKDTKLVMEKLDELHISTCQRPITERRSDRTIVLGGVNRESALCTLLTLREPLTQAIRRTLEHDRLGASHGYTYHILAEFERLVDSSLQENAAQHPQSTATSLDRWYYSDEVGKSQPAKILTRIFAGKRNDIDGLPYNKAGSNESRLRRRYAKRTIVQETPIGYFVFVIPDPSKGNKQKRVALESKITFIPKSHMHPSVVTARFLQNQNVDFGFKLCTQLNIFQIIEDANQASRMSLYLYGSLEEIDTAFRTGRISPYDTNRHGVLLSHLYAGAGLRVDVLKYLNSQGVGPTAMNGESSTLTGAIFSFVYIKSPDYRIDQISYIQSDLEECLGFDMGSEVLQYLWDVLQKYTEDKDLEKLQRLLNILQHWRGFFLRNGLEDILQGPDEYHSLIRHCRRKGRSHLDFIHVLLALGADPNMLSSSGHSAIQHAMLPKRQDFIELEDRLFVLLEAGTSIHHRGSGRGLTASVYAKGWGCWKPWCRALKRAGFDIEEILRIEMNEWLQEDGWEDRLEALRFKRFRTVMEMEEEGVEETSKTTDKGAEGCNEERDEEPEKGTDVSVHDGPNREMNEPTSEKVDE